MNKNEFLHACEFITNTKNLTISDSEYLERIIKTKWIKKLDENLK